MTASFTYDALGRRVSKTINGVRTDYQYDGNDIIAEIGGGTAINATYVRSLNIDEPFARITSSTTEFYHTDALGSVFALTDANGNSTASYTYDPFGNTTQSGNSTSPFTFTGRESDSGTGILYFRARYYSPALQRFVSEDPIRLKGRGINFYSYAENSPINNGDPLGLFCVPLPSVKGPWTKAFDKGITYYAGGFSTDLNFGFCQWQKRLAFVEERSVQERSFCCSSSKKCGFSCRTELGEKHYEYRDNFTVLDTATSPILPFSFGGDIEHGSLACCTNPWTGRTTCTRTD